MVEASGPPLADLLVNILSDPLSVVLVLFGALFVGFSVAVFGYLATGAALDTVIPDIGREPPQRGE